MSKKNNMIIILDGLGIGKEYEGNAFYLANTPVIDNLIKNYPNTQIEASGEFVGLPKGQMGNSEVGHLNIGAGRVVYQNLLRINNAISDGSFFENEVLNKTLKEIKKNDNALHLVGLLSDGGVHSHEKHLYALMELAKKYEIQDVYIHIILDGRDVSQTAGKKSIKKLEEKIEELNIGTIATVSGRYYAMDRDKNWSRTEKSYEVIADGIGEKIYDIDEYIEDSYNKNVTDEFILPRIVGNYEGFKDGDGIIFFNFRPDRARQLTRAVVDDDFSGFSRRQKHDVKFVSMTEYDSTIKNVEVIFKELIPEMTLGEYVSKLGLKQLRIAETEKYAHVTFFFNGGIEKEFEGEDRILVSSPKVKTFDLKPEMSAEEVADKVIDAISEMKYDLIILNFANCDMVGHTGNIPATIKAVETVDFNLGRILEKLYEKDGCALITADHGNCELMLTEDNEPITSHSSNPVFLILFNYDEPVYFDKGGRLCDLAPTLLDIMNVELPKEMTGRSLIRRSDKNE